MRNPSYDPATDNTEIRQSNPDRFEITVNTNLDNIFDQIERGELETSFETPPNAVVRRYLQDPEIRERLRVNAGDRIWFAYMNLTTPPFDDVHVRKAMNLVMDLEGIQRAWGGPVSGSTPTHMLPKSLLDIPDYFPYQQPPFAGDVEAAKAEMAQSKYDTDQDGTCDAAPCKGVINLNRNFAPWSTISPIIEQSAAQIGIDIETREASRTAVNNTSNTTARKIPFSSGNGWGKDYADPSTFFVIYDGRNIIPVGNTAFALVGRDEGPGEGARDHGPARRRAEHQRRHRQVHPAHRAGAHRLLDGPRQEAHGGDRAAGGADGRDVGRARRAGGHPVRLRPVRHRAVHGPRRRRPVPAELRGGDTD